MKWPSLNAQIVSGAFLGAHPDFALVNAAEILAQQQIALDTGKYLKLLPHLHQTDGFFAAVFQKAASSEKAAVTEKIVEQIAVPEKTLKPKKSKTTVKGATPRKAAKAKAKPA
jgi:16S rRNA (cytosine967-C5)-methyltransferase